MTTLPLSIIRTRCAMWLIATATSFVALPVVVADTAPATRIELVSAVPNGDWRLPAGDYAHTRYSALDEITRENVGRLRMIHTFSTGIPHGHEGGPLVVDEVMYIVTPYPNKLIAVDLAAEGYPIKWVYAPNPAPQSVGVACCDVVNRGASYGDGKIVFNLLDAHTVAVDAVTGKEV